MAYACVGGQQIVQTATVLQEFEKPRGLQPSLIPRWLPLQTVELLAPPLRSLQTPLLRLSSQVELRAAWVWHLMLKTLA